MAEIVVVRLQTGDAARPRSGGYPDGLFPSGDGTIKPIAFALAAGILFDAVVVRMLLMLAALTLLGSRDWWLPTWLSWLSRLDVEGTALETHRPTREPPRPLTLPDPVGPPRGRAGPGTHTGAPS